MNRDVIAQICNYICPIHQGKTTTLEEFARTFSHTQKVHGEHYSSEIFNRASDGRPIMNDVSVAREFHVCFGEKRISTNTALYNQIKSNIMEIVSTELLSQAAKHVFKSSIAVPTLDQVTSIQALDDENDRNNLIVKLGCGRGKSAIYTLPLAARALGNMKRRKLLVISPHGPLLLQHYSQAKKAFLGLDLKVAIIRTMDDVLQPDFPRYFDLCFISIHTFNMIEQKSSDIIFGWRLDAIIIDECHLMYLETFRHEESWRSLHNLAVYKTKIVCMTATINRQIARHMGCFLQLGEYKTIGEESYQMPEVAITLHKSNDHTVLREVVDHCIDRLHLYNVTLKKKGVVHVITRTKAEAETGSKMMNDGKNSGRHCYNSSWLTSTTKLTTKRRIICEHDEGEIQVIWSTYDVGLDSKYVRDVVIMGGCESIVGFIQSIGRIRPAQQVAISSSQKEAQVHVFLTIKGTKIRTSIQVEKGKSAYETRIGLFSGYIDTQEKITSLRTHLFTRRGIASIFSGRECIMKAAMKSIDVLTPSCTICSNCIQYDNVTKNAISADQDKKNNAKKETFVREKFKFMETACYVCKSTECDGKSNCRNRFKVCWKCMSNECTQGSQHCDIRNLPVFNNACVFCFLPKSFRGPNTQGETHRRGKCIHKERIKRVMLYHCKDGKDAATKLQDCFRAQSNWMHIFVENIKTIDNNHTKGKIK